MHKLARLTPMGRLRMVRRLEAGARLCDVATALDLSTTSVRRWWRRYQAEGIAGLSDRSSRPHRSPRALPRVQRRQIARRRQWGWSSLRIARDLRLPLPTVVHVQRRLGLARRPRPPLRRCAGTSAPPGELVHLDIKKLGRFRRVGHRIHGDHGRRSRGSGTEFLHIAIDDRTRLAYAALFPDETAASAAAFLALAHRWFAARGVAVRGLLTDNGSAYRGHRFGALCGRLGLGTTGPGPIGRRPTARPNASFAPVWENGPTPARILRPSPERAPCPISCDTTTRIAFTWASTASLPCSDSRHTANNVFINYS